MTTDIQIAPHRLDSVAWGMFFVWVGFALLANFGWGIGLLGTGIIVLGGQALRKYFALPLETFWLIIGLAFVFAGVWELLSLRVGLIPIVCIAAGIVLLLSALQTHPKD